MKNTLLAIQVILKIQKSSGYSTIGLNQNSKRDSFLIHRLVAQAFIPNPENKLTVNHINHDKHDNRVINLEWNTQKEQNDHNYKSETKKRTTTRATQGPGSPTSFMTNLTKNISTRISKGIEK